MKRTALTAALLLLPPAADAVECPPPMPSCKILILSPQEEAILTQPNGILPTAAEARKVDFAGAVQYFLQRIKEAPNGDLPKPAATPAPENKAAPDGK